MYKLILKINKENCFNLNVIEKIKEIKNTYLKGL